MVKKHMIWSQTPVFRFQSYQLLAVTLYKLLNLSVFQLLHFYHWDINTIRSTLLALKVKNKILRRLGHMVSTQRVFRSDLSLSRVQLFATPWIAEHQGSLSNTNFRRSLRLMSIKSVMPSSHLCCPLLLLPPIPPMNLLKLMFIESVMLSNHLILCCSLLLLPLIFSSIRVFSNEAGLVQWVSSSNQVAKVLELQL